LDIWPAESAISSGLRELITNLLERLTSLLADPVYSFYRLRAKLGRQGLWRRYAALAAAAGFKKLFLVLSFDCDTVEDTAVAWEVHTRVLDMGVKPVYAVPGELLQQGEEVYSRIRAAGGEFINHGYAEHTYLNIQKQEYASCFFYDQLSPEQVREDIIQGDACVKDILGHAPQGFRCPHFGTFKKSEQLCFLHSVLGELKYQFSTSTLPFFAFRYGPVFDRFGVREIPVSGTGSNPFEVLDSWACFAAPGRLMTPQDYVAEGAAAARLYKDAGIGLLNYYADPSHIHNQEAFFETIRLWSSLAQPINFQDLLEGLP
jgi:hypothetical protein